MGKCMRKCKSIGGVAVMEAAAKSAGGGGGGVRTRARTLALAAAAAASTAGAGSGRRRTESVAATEIQISSYLQLRSRRLVITTTRRASPANSQRARCRSPAAASRCSSNASCELAGNGSLRSADLEGEEFETAVCSDCRNREATPSSDLRGGPESDSIDSTTRPSESNPRRRSSEVRMPSEAEIEEFLSAAEKAETKRFAEKYNYDVVKDAPLDGRYEWIRLKQ